MELSDNDIDKLFKDNLSDLNLTFDPKAWNSMQKKMKANKWRKFILLSVFALISIAAIAFFSLNNSSTINNSIVENNSNIDKSTTYKSLNKSSAKEDINNKIDIQTDDNEVGIKKSNYKTNLEAEKTLPSNNSKDKTKSLASSNKILSKSNNTSKRISKKSSNNIENTANNTKPEVTPEKTASNSSSFKKNNPNDNNSISNSNSGVKQVAPSGEELPNNINTTKNNKSTNTDNNFADNSDKIKQEITSNKIATSNDVSESNNTSNSEHVLNNFNTRESIELYSYESIELTKMKQTIIDSSINELLILKDSIEWREAFALELYPNLSNTKIGTNDFQIVNPEVKPVFGFGIAFNYLAKRTKRWDLTIGLGYTNIGFETNYEQEITTEIYYKVKDTYTYHFVDLQLGINYYLSRKKLSFYLNATPEINFSLAGRVKQQNTPLSGFDIPRDGKYNIVANTVMSSINFGIGVDYQVNKKWNIYLLPNYKFYVIPYNSTSAVKRTPFSYGVKLGIRYNIYKAK